MNIIEQSFQPIEKLITESSAISLTHPLSPICPECGGLMFPEGNCFFHAVVRPAENGSPGFDILIILDCEGPDAEEIYVEEPDCSEFGGGTYDEITEYNIAMGFAVPMGVS